MLFGVIMLPPRAMDCLLNTTVPGIRNNFCSYLSGEPKRIPKPSLWTIAIALNCFPEFEVRLLLKTPHTLDTGLGRVELGGTGKPSPRELALIVSESVMQVVKGEEEPLVLPSWDDKTQFLTNTRMTGPARYPQRSTVVLSPLG